MTTLIAGSVASAAFPDPEIWEMRGKGWYRKGIASQDQNTYYVKTCGQCGNEYLGQRNAKLCSAACAAESLRGRLKTETPAYRTVHSRISKASGKASEHACADCGQAARQWSYDGTDPGELTDPATGCKYSADPAHYRPRCHLCHVRADQRFGEHHVSAKLTGAQVRAIQASVGVSDQELAKQYGVSRSHVNRLRKSAGRNRSAEIGGTT